MNYLKEKNKMRPIWKTKRDQLFLNSTDKDKDYFLKNFISTFNELDGKVVAGYNPIGSEVNCLEILKYSFSKGALISLPFVNKKKFIEFREWKEGDDLEFDHSNILAPSNKNILVPDIILIPLLCFDLKGTRLGLGGGIYDRTLPFFDLSDKFGLAFSGQQANHIYREDHDFPVDGVITEKEVITFKGKKIENFIFR